MIDWIVANPQFIVALCEFILVAVAVLVVVVTVKRMSRQQKLDDAEFRRLMAEYRRRMDRNLDFIDDGEEVMRRVN